MIRNGARSGIRGTVGSLSAAGSDASGDWAGALFSSGVAFGPGVPERTSPVPLGDAEELGAAVGSSSSPGGDVGCEPGTDGRGVLPGGGDGGRGVAPGGGVGVGAAVGRGVGLGVGGGVGA